MIDLVNRTALVTGGSRGIGKACVRYLINAGADVAFTFITAEHFAAKLCNEFKNKNKIKSFMVNNSNENDIKNVINLVLNEFGKIDILVNNAGIWERSEIEKLSSENWDRTININLTGSFLFTKYTVPVMKKNKFGRIINISSTAGQRGEAFYSHYAASKGGMIAFTKSLAVELGQFNITVNNVAPGWVKTDMTKNVFENMSEEEKILEEIPLRKIALPEDIAGAVVFLASELASHITGCTIDVNGGAVL